MFYVGGGRVLDRKIIMFARLLLLGCVALLCSCSTSLQSVGDIVQVFSRTSNRQLDRVPLDSRYRYLRVAIHGRSTVLILGYVDEDALGPIETWYSPGGVETIRLQNGRFVGGSGLPIEWRNVHLSAQPLWQSVETPTQIERRRDVMPGYDFGLVDKLTVEPIKVPSGTSLYGKPHADWHWYEDVSSGDAALPPSRYAVETVDGKSSVVYGEQCLTRSFCISWQRWPANS